MGTRDGNVLIACKGKWRKAMNCLRGFSESIAELNPDLLCLPGGISLRPATFTLVWLRGDHFHPTSSPSSPTPSHPTPPRAHRTRPQRSGRSPASPAGPHRAGAQRLPSRARTIFPSKQWKSHTSNVLRRARMDNVHQLCAGIGQSPWLFLSLVFL